MRFLAIIAVKLEEVLHISNSHLKVLFRNTRRNTTFMRLPIYEKRRTFAGTNRI